jgi:hypothetical protein
MFKLTRIRSFSLPDLTFLRPCEVLNKKDNIDFLVFRNEECENKEKSHSDVLPWPTLRMIRGTCGGVLTGLVDLLGFPLLTGLTGLAGCSDDDDVLSVRSLTAANVSSSCRIDLVFFLAVG